jgi:hypothetical protein
MTGIGGPATPLLSSSTPLPPTGEECTWFVLSSQDVLLRLGVLADFKPNPATREIKTSHGY